MTVKELFAFLADKDLTFEQYFILKSIDENTVFFFNKKKYHLDIQFLIRKGYIAEISEYSDYDLENFYITEFGKGILGTELPNTLIQTVDNDSFEEFWNTYPTTDKHLGFPKTRILRVNKTKSKKEYYTILKEGKYSSEDILKALKYEIEMMKTGSSLNENKFKFMLMSTTWLNQRRFEDILEGMSSDHIEDKDWTSDVI